MDQAVTLVRSVMRAFSSVREILVIDALILHETLRDDDLAYLMSINTKDLHKICGKLREERFLSVYEYILRTGSPFTSQTYAAADETRHTRPEWREGNTRPHNRTWYYINYRTTIDAIKWRVYTIDKEVQGTHEIVTEKKEYFCGYCKAEWTQMEVLGNAGPKGFLCHRCNHVLNYEADRNASGHEQLTRLNDQFKFISELLPRIDSVRIPECDFDRAFAKARPVVRDAMNMRAATSSVDPHSSKPMAVKGLINTGPQSIAVNISTSDGPSEAEKEAERQRKDKIAQQNALPAWMSNSTVTGESFTTNSTGPVPAKKEEPDPDSKVSEALVDAQASVQIDNIFERLKAEQAAERAREMKEECSTDGDEEGEYGSNDDEFEDVPASGVGTPNTVGTGTNNGSTPVPAIKREMDTATSREGSSSEERSVKRVKVEEKPVMVKKEEDSEEDEELEFEDV